jgi:hypothetical protein
MSLKAGAKRSAVGPPFVGLIFDEEDLLVGAVGMWKSRSDFQLEFGHFLIDKNEE